ncbi:MAG: aldo/keto reductase [Eubacteriales bacterium]|nr:aldo/keto reductase [Christensenellaceae bacterium]MEA5066923.1 aldo/keto reductase [Eubacteriales bacterium]
MTIFDGIFPLGMGTNRFKIDGPDDERGVESAAAIVAAALDASVSYVDVGYSYSRGMAETVCKLAFKRTKSKRNVTIKSSFIADMRADDALRRVETSFSHMEIDHAAYFVVWNIESYAQFGAIMRKGALYEGALKAKERGLVDHICFSTHAPAAEIVKIIESGAFEGATISLSVLNSSVMQPVLECATRNDVGIVVMNPLGGGIVPQNSEYYSFLKNADEDHVATAALRFVAAHPAVKVVLSGMSTMEELRHNLRAFQADNAESDCDRIKRVYAGLRGLDGFCTGCGYCDGCPVGIPISSYMQSNNARLFQPTPAYNRSEPELLKSIQLFRKLYLDFHILPECSDNPCIQCGRCEKRCTQGLKIMKALEEIHANMQRRAFCQDARKERLGALLHNKGYKLVGFYPGAGYSNEVVRLYKSFFGQPDFKIIFFDSNPKLWHSSNEGIPVYPPDQIAALQPEIIVVSNYIYQDEIYATIKCYERDGIHIEKLHCPDDVPWVF